MPGSSLNDTERRLLDWWEKAKSYRYPVLRGLSIKGEKGLRGIRELQVRFDYPLAAICGRNGSGKSTLLALAALGFHSPAGHVPIGALRPVDKATRSTYYTFRDFFFQGPGDPDLTGIEIVWEYDGATVSHVKIRKQSDKWMKYERRPRRPVHFLGIARAVPAIEQKVLRAHFPSRPRSLASAHLNDQMRERYSEIMNRAYTEASILNAAKYSVRTVRSSSDYSSFNMGAGEDVVLELLWLFQQAPEGSLLVIEEIESGLHPEAVQRLARHMQEIMFDKKLQVIVSTHSEHFLDSIPRQARLLIRRGGGSHEVIRQPTTRFAVGLMALSGSPELDVGCEDSFSEELIKAALPSDVLRRCRFIPIGSKAELCTWAKYQQKSAKARILLIWDGDTKPVEIERWLTDSKLPQVQWTRLPGDCAPESWAIKTLDNDVGHKILARELALGTTCEQAQEYVSRLTTVSDPHAIPYELGKICSVTHADAVRAIVRAVSRLPGNPMGSVVEAVARVLDSPLAAQEVAATSQQPGA